MRQRSDAGVPGRIRVLVALGACLTFVSLAGAGEAAAASWTCSARAVDVQAVGGDRLIPIAAGRNDVPCSEVTAGAPNVGAALNLSPTIEAQTAYAATRVQNDRPLDQTPGSFAGVEGLAINGGDTPILAVGAARSQVTARCETGSPLYEGVSEVASITLGGVPIVLDGVVQPITDAVSDALGVLVEVRLNEQVPIEGGGLEVRAARVTLLSGAGTPLADVVIAASRASQVGNPCDPNDPSNLTPGGPTTTAQPCPPGSVYNQPRNLCVIPCPGSQTTENPLGNITGPCAIVIGPPFAGPSGGSVISLTEARGRFRSRCLSGSGSRYVIYGTNRRDRITGTNRGDRILLLGGRDDGDGGRGADCVDGGSGRDIITGGLGNDRIYGGTGRDAVNGDSGNDRLYGQAGNDTSNAGFGADYLSGGSGNDKLNTATPGRRSRVNCGSGRDLTRVNRDEVRRTRHCERVALNRGGRAR